MTTETQTNSSSLLKKIWPDSFEQVAGLLETLREHECRLALFNLPKYYRNTKRPTDIDIMIHGDDYTAACDLLIELGLVPLTHKIGHNQRLFVLRLDDGGFFRFHLHQDLYFHGLKLISFEQIEPFLQQAEDVLIPSAELDIVLLHLQWFFRRKRNYPARIDQVFRHVNRIELDRVIDSLVPATVRLIRHLIAACADKVEISALRKLSWSVSYFPFHVGQYLFLMRRLLSAIRPYLFGRRQGLLVYFMGIDGTGKTSAASGIVKSHDQGGAIARYAYLGLKETWVQKVRSRLIKQNERERFDGQSGVADRLATRSSLASNLFNLGITVIYLVDYFIKTMHLLRFVRLGNNLIVIDRSYYDKLTEPGKLGNKLFYYLLPKPDLVVALHGGAETLYQRKREFEIEVLVKMQDKMDDAWEFLEQRELDLLKIDSCEYDQGEVIRRANDRIWQMFISKT